jgi:hypothetical protein
MAEALEPVRPITLNEVREARERIAGTVMRPLWFVSSWVRISRIFT